MTRLAQVRPWIAAVLSAVVPGLGHAYLRRWLRGGYWFGLAVLAGSVPVPEPLLSVAGTSQRLASIGLVGFVAVVSVVDAYRDALFSGRRPETTPAAGETEYRCRSCGREADGDLPFCHWCGERFPETSSYDKSTTDGIDATRSTGGADTDSRTDE